MLKKILSSDDCAACRFCCSFRRQSLWETPLFEKESLEKLHSLYPEAKFKSLDEKRVTVDLDGDYRTDDPQEEALCCFNHGKGCVLDGELKPLDCKIWPLRVMKMKDGKTVIALTPTCPVISEKPLDGIKALVREEIGDTIISYASRHPEMIKDYREGFPVLLEIGEGKL